MARLNISRRTETKLRSVHGLDPFDVRDAVECVAGLRGTWHLHPDRGRRLLVKTKVKRRNVLVVLYPVEGAPDEWNLGSAYVITRS